MIELLLQLAMTMYILSAVLLACFVGSFSVLLILYARTRHAHPTLPDVRDADLPSVTVQLPIYNEAHVAARLIDACAQIDYPPGKLRVQVIDDSTDHTPTILRHQIVAWQARGITYIELLHRPDRAGYKAGALAHGLARTSSDLVAVFDADFIPPPDFLRQTAPFFCTDDRLGMVQTRWEHLNADANWLTRAQALTLDGHFAVEQTARYRGGLPVSMNGTGALWRVAALHDAGGWSAATLTEDLDLSYRAQRRGWRFLYHPDIAVPGEIPPQIQAYKLQQRRWATGMTENLIRHALPLLRAPRFTPLAKVMGLAHLASYAVQPLILSIFLLTPLLIAGDRFARMPNFGVLFGAVGAIAPAIMVTGQIALRRRWWRTLWYLPVQGLLGAAMALNNTVGVLAALHDPAQPRAFLRTPKFAGRAAASRYALPLDAITLGELLLALYAIGGGVLALDRLPALVPYLLTYAVAFGGIALMSVVQHRRVALPGIKALSPQRTRRAQRKAG